MCETKKQNRSPQEFRNPGSGFTLVELLLVIAIISVLAVMSLGVLQNAQDSARSSATQARITQIESLLAIELEDYEVRRLPISNRELVAYVRANRASAEETSDQFVKLFVQVQALRRQILMDIINSEFPRPYLEPEEPPVNPDDCENVPHRFRLSPDVGSFPSDVGSVPLGECPPPVGMAPTGFRTWLDENYATPVNGVMLSARLEQVKTAAIRSFESFPPSFPAPAPPAEPPADEFNLPGEYLYAALARMDIDGTPAVELIGNAAIGNVDGDSFPELIDAWGEPLQLRILQVGVKDPMDPDTANRPSIPDPGEYVGTGDPVVHEDVVDDDDIDFDVLDSDAVPLGYAGLDPIVPREIRKIRFQVISTRMARDQGLRGPSIQDPR